MLFGITVRMIASINSSITDFDYSFGAHFDSKATMLVDNPKVENLTTSDGFLITD